MKSRRSASVTRTIPSAADISEQTQKMFDNAGSDIKPIRIKTAADVSKEIEFLEDNITEGVEWDVQVSAMQRGMALVNGAAFENDIFLRGFNRIYPGLVAAATNLRSALVKQSCLFIAQIAREIGPAIDSVGDFVTPLSSQLSHGTQIIAESCKLAILCISKYCPSRKILKSIFDICNARGAAVKAVAAESLSLILLYWPVENLNQNFVQIESLLQKLLGDAAVNTRTFARQAAKAYLQNFPQKAASFISRLDQRTQKSINDCILSHKQQLKYNIRSNLNDLASTEQQKQPPSRSKDPLSKTSEKVDIAANPPRVVRPKKIEEDVSYQKQTDPYTDDLSNIRPRKSSVGRKTTQSNQEVVEERSNIRKKRYSVNDASSKRKRDFDLINEDDISNSNNINNNKANIMNTNDEYEMPHIKTRTKNQFSSQKTKEINQTEFNNENNKVDFTEIQQPSTRYRAKYTQNASLEQQNQSNQREPMRQNNEDVLSRPRSKFIEDYQEEDTFLPKMRQPKRQSSVQPQRRDDPRRNILQENSEDSFNQEQHKIVEKRKPIILETGDEKNYLLYLQSFVDEDKISDLASSMSYISRDLVNSCSNPSAVISSQALSILLSILPMYAPHFRSILSLLVETVLSQAEVGNPRSSNTAKQILNELHRSFDCNTLLLICTKQNPSVPLLNFTDSLVSLSDVDIENEKICLKLLTLAFRCYNLGNISNRRTAARIIERVNNSNSQAVRKFTDSLRDRQLKQFDEYIKPYLPNLQVRAAPEVPRYNPKNPKQFLQKLDAVTAMPSGAEWIDVRPHVYTELLEALKGGIEDIIEPLLGVIFKLFTTHDVEDFQTLLPGLLLCSRGNKSKVADILLSMIVSDRDPVEVFASLQHVINGPDAEIARAALGFQTRLIATLNKKDVYPLISSLIPGLTKAFESHVAEVRKAVVLCFVELYAQFDKEIIDRHTSHLSKGQLKLIGIYLSRRNE